MTSNFEPNLFLPIDEDIFLPTTPVEVKNVTLRSNYKIEDEEIESLILSMLRFNQKLVLGGSFGIELFQSPLSERTQFVRRDIDFQIQEKITDEEIEMMVDMFQLKKLERPQYKDEDNSDIMSFIYKNIKIDIFIESCIKKHDAFVFSYLDSEENEWELRVGHPKYAYAAKTRYVLSSSGFNDKHYKDVMKVFLPQNDRQ